MKVAHIISIFVASTLATVSGQTETWCRCGAFVSYEYMEMMVYEAPEITIASCSDEQNECKKGCAKELNEGSMNGDLWMLTSHGTTVGQEICSELASKYVPRIHNKRVYGYYEICGGAWQYAGVQSQQLLCCDGGQHEHCVS